MVCRSRLDPIDLSQTQFSSVGLSHADHWRLVGRSCWQSESVWNSWIQSGDIRRQSATVEVCDTVCRDQIATVGSTSREMWDQIATVGSTSREMWDQIATVGSTRREMWDQISHSPSDQFLVTSLQRTLQSFEITLPRTLYVACLDCLKTFQTANYDLMLKAIIVFGNQCYCIHFAIK